MATIIKKTKKGRAYYYAVECKRINGKPRIAWQKYLGTLDAIIGRVEGEFQPPRAKEAVIFDAGGVAALLRIAQQLQLQQLIDEHAPKRDQGPSVGQYILLAAINRALAPCSKLAIGDWYEKTVLRRLWGFDSSAFSSPRFWDHMDRVSEEAIDRIQEQLALRVREHYAVQSPVLLYDTTNFFTFLASTNYRSQLAQRGRNKQKRHDLRQIGLALVVSRDFQIPLLHKTYAGNIPDVALFAQMSQDLLGQYAKLAGLCEATLVFDKGNVCDDAMENLIVPGTHFVAALPANRFPELLATAAHHFLEVPGMPGTKTWLFGRICGWDR